MHQVVTYVVKPFLRKTSISTTVSKLSDLNFPAQPVINRKDSLHTLIFPDPYIGVMGQASAPIGQHYESSSTTPIPAVAADGPATVYERDGVFKLCYLIRKSGAGRYCSGLKCKGRDDVRRPVRY